ncbi:MAG TPA: MFS transporter [Solirubrobacteraceae bacterium]|nr:MFS transporter [Solirubrobacteraceae bacterium]
MTATQTTEDHVDLANPHHDRRWLILALLGTAQLMVVLDATVVNIALPSAQNALRFSDANRQWVVTAYSLTFGSLLLLFGRFGDLFGRKRTLMIGLVAFGVVSAIGGAAQSFGMLVTARAFQGAAGALLAPSALSLLTTTFSEPRERGIAFGIYGAIAGAGGAVGLLLGGVLTEYLSWRWCLYVNVAIAVPAVFAAFVLLTNQVPATRPRLDVPGAVAVSLGLFLIVYGFSQAEPRGWTDWETLGSLIAGVIILAVFVVIERQAAHPLLPLRIVLDRNRGGSYLSVLISGAGLFGVFLFLTYYLQKTLLYSPVVTGLAFLPMVAMIIIGSTTSNAVLLPRFGPKPLVPTGMLLAALGMVILAQLGVHSSYAADILPALLVTGLGLGLIFAPSINTATLGVGQEDAGVASATVNSCQQVGGSIGTAFLNTIATTAVTSYLAGKALTPLVSAQAAVHGYTVAFWWAAGIFLLGALVSGTLLRPGTALATAGEAQPAPVAA